MTLDGNPAARLMTFALAGVLFGVITSAANVSGIPVVPQIIGVGWSWAAVGIASAAIAPRRPTLTVLVVLVAAVAGYYLSDLTLGVYNDIDFSDPRAMLDPAHAPLVTRWDHAIVDFVVWAAFAAAVSWPLGRIGVATRRRDGWGLAARTVVPLGAAVEVLALRLPSELAVQPSAVAVTTYVVEASLGIAVTLLLCALYIHGAIEHARRPDLPK